jgi:hypothetical protein
MKKKLVIGILCCVAIVGIVAGIIYAINLNGGGGAKALSSIAVTTSPRIEYSVGEAFDPNGMVVTATFNDESTAVVANTELTYKTTALAETDTAITISYVKSGVTKTADLAITVIDPEGVDHLAIETQPAKTAYLVGEAFDPAGMVVRAYYNNSTTAVIADDLLTYGHNALTTADTSITITYQTKTADVSITVEINPATRAANLNASILSLPSIDAINQKTTEELEALQATLDGLWDIYNGLPELNKESVTSYAYLEAVTVLVDALLTEGRNIIYITFKSFDGLTTLLTREIMMSGYSPLEPYNRTPIDFISALETTGKFVEGFYTAAGGESEHFSPTDNAVIIRVKFYETKKVTVTDISSLNWKLTFSKIGTHFNDPYPDGRDFITNGEYYPADGMAFDIPTGSRVTVISLDPRITNIHLGDISPNASSVIMNELIDNCGLSFDNNPASSTSAYIIFTQGSEAQHTFEYTDDELIGDLKLVQSKLTVIATSYETAEILKNNVVTYTYNGQTYTYAQLSTIVFANGAGAVNVVSVNVVPTKYFVSIYLADDNNAIVFRDGGNNVLSPFLTETLRQYIERSDFSYLTSLVYYKNSARTIRFTDFDAILTQDIKLYAAKRGTFVISFNTGDGTSTNSINVDPGLTNNEFWNMLNSRTSIRYGFALTGWSRTQGGVVPIDMWNIEGEFVSIRNAPITLYAIWTPVETINGETAAILTGTWFRGTFSITFDEHGNGTWREFDKVYDFTFIGRGESDSLIINILGEGDKHIWGISSSSISVDGPGECYKVGAGIIKVTIIINDGQPDSDDMNAIIYIGNTSTIYDILSGGIYSSYNYYFNRVLIENPDAVVISTKVIDGELFLLALNDWMQPEWITLNLDGGTMPEGYLPYVWIANYKMSKLADPIKEGYYFLGWYTQAVGGERITDWEFFVDNNMHVTDLYAHFYEGSSVNYTGEDFVGRWEAEGRDAGKVTKVTLILNADGTFSITTLRDTIQDLEYSGTGIYRYDGEKIIIISFTGVYAPEINIKFLDNDIICIKPDTIFSTIKLLTRDGGALADYSGNSLIGTYYGMVSYYGHYVAIILNADGTINFLDKVVGGNPVYPGSGTFRIVDGQAWWLETNENITGWLSTMTRS